MCLPTQCFLQDPGYLGGQGGNANWSNWSRADVTNRSLAIQAVLSEKFNYAIELEGHGCCSAAQNRTIALANAHPERTLDVIIMRAELPGGMALMNKSLPAGSLHVIGALRHSFVHPLTTTVQVATSRTPKGSSSTVLGSCRQPKSCAQPLRSWPKKLAAPRQCSHAMAHTFATACSASSMRCSNAQSIVSMRTVRSSSRSARLASVAVGETVILLTPLLQPY